MVTNELQVVGVEANRIGHVESQGLQNLLCLGKDIENTILFIPSYEFFDNSYRNLSHSLFCLVHLTPGQINDVDCKATIRQASRNYLGEVQ